MNFMNINTIASRIRERFSGDSIDRSDRIATIDTIATRAQSECIIKVTCGLTVYIRISSMPNAR